MYTILAKDGGYCETCYTNKTVVRRDMDNYMCKDCLREMIEAIEAVDVLEENKAV